jgi:hypothetical protein
LGFLSVDFDDETFLLCLATRPHDLVSGRLDAPRAASTRKRLASRFLTPQGKNSRFRDFVVAVSAASLACGVLDSMMVLSLSPPQRRPSGDRIAIGASPGPPFETRARGAVLNGGCLSGGTQPFGLATHPPILRGRVMVPAEQVQEAVCEEHRQLRAQVPSCSLCLASCGRDAHDDVAEEPPGALAMLALALGESENVGRLILLSIDPVQLLDLIVAREKNRELCLWQLNSGEHRPRATDDVDP